MKRLFDIDDTGKVQLEDTTYMLVPELSDVYNRKKLGWKAITYIVCVCDYHSPYRQLLLADRIDAVCEDIYGTKNYPPLSLDIVEKAMEKYKKLQSDPIYEQDNIYTEKLSEYNDYVRKMPIENDNAKMLQDVMLGQEKLVAARENLKHIILKAEDEKLQGGGGISFLEEYNS